jgi:hypothetical protein
MWWRLDVDDFHHYHAFDVHGLGKKLDKHGINHRFYQIWDKKKEMKKILLNDICLRVCIKLERYLRFELDDVD